MSRWQFENHKAFLLTSLILLQFSCSSVVPMTPAGTVPLVQQKALALAPSAPLSVRLSTPVVASSLATGTPSPSDVITMSRGSDFKNDPDSPPNQVPQSFVQEKWNNRIRLFADDNTGVFTSDFGWRGLNGKANFHQGVDLWCKEGTTVLSPVSGVVVKASSAGKQSEIVVRNGKVLHTLLHVRPITSLEIGQKISKGQVIGKHSSYNHFEYATYVAPGEGDGLRGRTNAVNPFSLHEHGHLVN
jgi:murein DD-endopeptidase MepM/ murein hydrolase activator NlpD